MDWILNDQQIIKDIDLQQLLFRLKRTAERYNMIVSTVSSMDPVRCLLAIYEKLIEQVMKCNYLGLQITQYQKPNPRRESKHIEGNEKIGKRERGHLEQQIDVNWEYSENLQDLDETDSHVCFWAETSKTNELMRSTEMKTIVIIKQLTLRYQIRSNCIREELKADDLLKGIRSRRRQ